MWRRGGRRGARLSCHPASSRGCPPTAVPAGVRYRRTILSPPRWLLDATQYPGGRAPDAAWEKALADWRGVLASPRPCRARRPPRAPARRSPSPGPPAPVAQPSSARWTAGTVRDRVARPTRLDRARPRTTLTADPRRTEPRPGGAQTPAVRPLAAAALNLPAVSRVVAARFYSHPARLLAPATPADPARLVRLDRNRARQPHGARSLGNWWPGIYEPEPPRSAATGAMDVGHALFTADSFGVLSLAAVGGGSASVSCRWCSPAPSRSGGLEWYAPGDRFDCVCIDRPLPRDVLSEKLTSSAKRWPCCCAPTSRPAARYSAATGPPQPTPTGPTPATQPTGHLASLPARARR
ncbi:hypothetical protein FraEuI1c_4519 [Pseudofrankia inefficax]|uniref:Lantibiotic dehydratase N-terminal domain-containing protein n=2 Tax=Pseudofrankia inefficax (strain DSM 45817 / CECT 9037 / DDB 130130 / EuI1c) TaxID=298654 RepID=E3IVK6_PSEI1|nr:hypothetical protein FraEuI1c_4519 [Pseudofrankia inefficax]